MQTNPHKSALNVSKTFKYIQIVFSFFALMMLTARASAQVDLGDITIGTIEAAAWGPPLDDSLKMLSGLAGKDFVEMPFSAVGSAETVFGSAMFIFNACLFTIGVAYVMYSMVIQIVRSANDGEVLGKNGDPVFMPIRTGIGVLGMVPVFGGFNLMQAVMMLTIVWGVGIANLMTTEVVERIDNMQSIMPAEAALMNGNGSMPGEIKGVAYGMFISGLCTELNNSQARYYDGRLGVDKVNMDLLIEPRYYGNSKGTQVTFDYGKCGNVTVTNRGSYEVREQGGIGPGKDFGAFRSGAVNYKEIADAVYAAGMTQINNLHTSTRALAREFIDELNKTETAKLDFPSLGERVKHYNDKLDSLARAARLALISRLGETTRGSESALNATVKENLKNGGWLNIGAWFSVLAEAGSAVNDAFAAHEIKWNGGPIINEAQEAINRFKTDLPPNSLHLVNYTQNAIALYMRDAANHAQPRTNKVEQAWCPEIAENQTGNCSPGQAIISNVIGTTVDDTGGAGLVNPIYVAKQLGDYAMVTGQSIMAAGAISSAMAKNPLMMAVSEVINSESIQGFAMALTVVGTLLSVFVVLQPLLVWISAVISYLCRVVESLIMATVWGFAHLKEGTGQQLVDGPAARGYKIALAMLLMPGVMVLGFIISVTMITYVGTWITNIFISGIASAQGNSMTGALTILGYSLVYFVVIITSVQFILTNCITNLIDRIMGWQGESDGASYGGFVAGAAASQAIRQASSARVGGGAGPKPSSPPKRNNNVAISS